MENNTTNNTTENMENTVNNIENTENPYIFCEYYGKCGGCSLQGFSPEEYKERKLSKITSPRVKDETKFGRAGKNNRRSNQELRERTKEHNAMSIFEAAEFIEPVKPLRRRINLKFLKKPTGLLIGFHAAHSNKIARVTSCPASMDEISSSIPHISKFLEENLLDKDSGEVYILKVEGGIAIKIFVESQDIIKNEIPRKLKGLVNQYSSNNSDQNIDQGAKIVSVKFYVNGNLVASASSSGTTSGAEDLAFIKISGIKVAVEADCFMQQLEESDKVIADFITSSLSDLKPKSNIIDLFCGRGTITLPLGIKGHKIDSYDFDDSALKSLATSSQDLSVKVHKRDLLYNPVTSLAHYDAIILNPPRSGARSQVSYIIDSGVKNLIYISCSPESFAKDAHQLQKNGYNLAKLEFFDQFKWTNHIEVLSYFTR